MPETKMHAPVAEPLRVGDWNVIPVRDGQWREAPADMWRRQESSGQFSLTGRGGAKEDWDRYPELLHRDGTLEMTIGSFLLVNGEKVVLVDTGQGPVSMGPLVGGELPDNLRRAGFEPSDVTDVVFTHLHVDHVGWASVGGEAFFPRAIYRCHERELDHDGHRDLPSLAPVLHRFETFGEDGPLLSGLDALLCAGHTPGSTAYVVSGSGQRAMLIGDTVHCVHELLEPDWSGMADHDPERARQTRAWLAEELESTGAYAAAGHFPGLSFGRLISRQHRNWTFARA